MSYRMLFAALAAAALVAGPLAAQDTTNVKKDTTGARPDTTGARKDTSAARPVADTTGARKDSAAMARPAQDSIGVRAEAAQAAAPAQQTDAGVKPGMTVDDVVARWGRPIATRTVNDWTYLFYRNRRERAVGYYDVVMLQHGQVMDAIVRSPEHVYAGVSSSPEGRLPVFTPPQHQGADSTQGAAVTGVRVKPSP